LGHGASRPVSAERNVGLAAGGTRAATTDGFGYSWFCDLYRDWAGRLKPTLRQVHIAGERLFVDFAGHTTEVIDTATGEIHRAEIFVAVLGASSFIYGGRPGARRCLSRCARLAVRFGSTGVIDAQKTWDHGGHVAQKFTRQQLLAPSIEQAAADPMVSRNRRFTAPGDFKRLSRASVQGSRPGAARHV